jgi:hypothetical protein
MIQREIAPTITVEAAMASPNPVTADNSSPTEEDNSETLREKFMKLISGDPQFREARKSGKAFVIGGAVPKTP